MWHFVSGLSLIAAAVLGTVVPATTGRAGTGSPPVKAGQAAWAPKLFGFCVDVADSKHRSIPEQARVLHELGFDGAGYELWLGADLDKNLRTLDEAGLKLYLAWIVVHLEPGAQPYKPEVPVAIRKLKGRPATICVLLARVPAGRSAGNGPGGQSPSPARRPGRPVRPADFHLSPHGRLGREHPIRPWRRPGGPPIRRSASTSTCAIG